MTVGKKKNGRRGRTVGEEAWSGEKGLSERKDSWGKKDGWEGKDGPRK